MIGKTLGRYRILERVGAGGMGVVFRARDSEMGMDVALKILSTGILADKTARRRFRQEVLSLVQLSHPGIATVYEFDTQGDMNFFVMEYLEGRTLAQKLRAGPLPIEATLDLMSQLASALSAAHGRGVVHRDLKPANVMVLPDGAAKVLDFGLARRVADAPRTEKAGSLSETLPISASSPSPPTRDGQVVGTLGYMSPEQVRAEAQDSRTDMFAFGCILYECLSGRKAFDGQTAEEIIAATLTQEPDWSALPAATPVRLKGLLERCLEKGAETRLRRADEARLALDELAGRAPDPSAELNAHPTNLPVQRSSFIGREKEISECSRLLEQERVLVLTGAGGCGKTRLSVEIGQRVLHRFPEGAWLVALGALADPVRIVQAVASEVGLGDHAGSSTLHGLAAQLRDRNMLLILDNCEHLIEASATLVRHLLVACPNLRVLATSRETLKVPGEHTFLVRPLSTPSPRGEQNADSIAPFESVRLFADRAALRVHSFRVDDANAPTVAEICRRLDGIPLAIELAAARAESGLESIRSKLDDRFRLLSERDQVSLSRHETLRAAIQWSYDLLTSGEQRLFRALSVFSGGWTLESASAVCRGLGNEFQILRLLTCLADKSLLVADRAGDGDVRYRMLETVSAHASEMLCDGGEAEEIRRLHSAHFLAMAELAEPNLVGKDQARWLRRLEEEHGNMLAALESCDRNPDGPELRLRLTNALFRFWFSHGHMDLGRKQLERAAALAGDTCPVLPRARALHRIGAMAYHQGDYPAAREAYDAALTLYKGIAFGEGIANVLAGLGNVANDLGDYLSAHTMYEESLKLHQQAERRDGIGYALTNLGVLSERQGDFAAARQLYAESLAHFESLGDREVAASVAANLATMHTRLGDFSSARRSLVTSLTHVREVGSKRSGAFALEAAMELETACGELRRAARFSGAAEAVMATIGVPMGPVERQVHADVVKRIESKLASDVFDSERAGGSSMSFEAVVDFALDRMATEVENHVQAAVGSSPGFESTAHLLVRVREGDEKAVDQLMLRYLPILRRWAHGRLPAVARGLVDTDDMVQLTLIGALRGVKEFEPRREGAFLAYLRKILMNHIRAEWRRAVRRPVPVQVSEEILDEGPSPLEATIRRGTYGEYERALGQLSVKQQEAIILRAELGFGYREVADAVGLASPDAARMLVRRALAKIAGLMPEGST